MTKEDALHTDSTNDAALELMKNKSREHARGLWEIIRRHAGEKSFSERKARTSVPPSHQGKSAGTLLRLLAGMPYLLAGLFMLSFFWDFAGISFELLGRTFRLEGLLKIVSVSGLIGYLTNWLAITMLFRPVRKRPLLGHGLIPAQKDRIAYRLAQTVSEDLINPEIIKRKIHESDIISRYREHSSLYIRSIIDDPSFRHDLKVWLTGYVEELFANREIRTAMAQKILLKIEHSLRGKSIERFALKTYTFVKGQEMQQIIEEILEQLPASVEGGLNSLDELLDSLPALLEENSRKLEDGVTQLLYKLINRLDVHALVEDNLRGYDEQKISSLIRNATNEQLRYIQYLGAVLGMAGGLIIWEPLVSTALFIVLGAGILGLDTLLMKVDKG